MSMEAVRRQHSVPAKRGTRILYEGGSLSQLGTITSATGSHLRVHFDGESRLRRHTLHPTWKLTYLDPRAA